MIRLAGFGRVLVLVEAFGLVAHAAAATTVVTFLVAVYLPFGALGRLADLGQRGELLLLLDVQRQQRFLARSILHDHIDDARRRLSTFI